MNDEQTKKPESDSGKSDGKDSGQKGKWRDKKRKDTPSKNDWSFYAASEQIAKDIASIPFNYLGGTPFSIAGRRITSSGGANWTATAALPSVIVLRYSDSIGVTGSGTTAINMASAQLYTRIRMKNSGAKNYEAPDVMMYVMALRDIYANFMEIKKIIGLVPFFNAFNHNIPTTLIAAMGVNEEDLRGNIAKYRAELNLLAKKINSFCVPKYFKAIDRAAFINSYIFTDSSSIRGQFYVYRRAGYYTWSGTASETGTSLVFTNTYQTNRYLSDMIANLEKQIDAIFYDSDALTMSGDIAKAFDEGELFQIQETPDNYMSPLAFDEDVLAQFENCLTVIPGDSQPNAYLDVTQEAQKIVFRPKFTFTGSQIFALTRAAFNSHKDNPDFKDVLEWTRLMTTFTGTYLSSNGSFQIELTSTGLEIPWYFEVIRINHVTGSNRPRVERIFINQYPESTDLGDTLLLSHFDWHPFIYPALESSPNVLPLPYGDSKVVTLIDVDTIKRINDSAVYGAFYGAGV